ncbi:MAG: hypothetical protein WCJ29_06395 [bacterium]
MNKTFKKVLSVATATMTVLSFVVIAQPAQAAVLTSISDVMSNQKISTLSAHDILFTTTAGGGGVASTENITIAFPAGFSIDSLVGADITVKVNGGSALTVVDGDPGANQYGLAIDVQNMVLTAGSGTAVVAAGNYVEIIISDDHITNPPTVGGYNFSILSGNQGDAGGFIVPIDDSSDVSVTATVTMALTFDLDMAATTTCAETAAVNYAVDFGTFTIPSLAYSDNSGVKAICADLVSNAVSTVVTVVSTNGVNGLYSEVAPAHAFRSEDEAMSLGVENYGLCVADPNLMEAVSPFNGSCVLGTATNTVGHLDSAAPQTVLHKDGSVTSNAMIMALHLGVAASTPAHAYSDTLRFIATGTF